MCSMKLKWEGKLQGTDNNTVTIYHLRIDILTYYNNNDNKKKMRIMQGRGKYFR